MKALIFILSILPAAALAQSHAHSGHAGAPTTSDGPTEAGQGGFAALAEIVVMLRSDPDTDWSQVDLGALRAHLQDMDRLMTDVIVEQRDVPGGLEMIIDRAAPGAAAALAMVPAHAPVLAAETGWQSKATVEAQRIVWTVTGSRNAGQIRGLGFFGLMAIGNHHPAHHLALAMGGSAN